MANMGNNNSDFSTRNKTSGGRVIKFRYRFHNDYK